MQDLINVEKLSDIEYKINIQVPKEKVEKKFDEFFEGIKKEANIPGFRKGRVPISHLKKAYYNEAKPIVAQSLISEYYAKMLKDNDINPVGNPIFDGFDAGSKYPGMFGFDGTYSVEMTTETLPKFEPTGYVGLDLDVPEYDDEEIYNSIMFEYQEKFAEHNQVIDRGAQLGDSLVIDFEGFMDGELFDGGSAKNLSIKSLGNDHFIPGFENEIVGMKIEETKEIELTFPKEYRAEHLAGKDVKFIVKVNSIVENKLAEVDEELAMMAGFSSIEEFENHVHKAVDDFKKFNNKNTLDNQITEKLLEINQFNVPKAMLKDEAKRIAGGRDLNNFESHVVEEINRMAEFNIKRAIIMDMIYEKEDDIEVTPDKLSDMLEEHAQKNNQTKDELVSNLYNSGQMDSFVGVLRVEQVIDFIIQNANNKENDD